jgi:riboflavin kinase/FMN adenylyltransferase
MKIFRDLSEITKNENSVITLGTFDGLHLGHQKIIETVVEKATKINGKSVLITFDPHPRKIISPDYKLELISTLTEKIEVLDSLGIDNIFIINFTKEFSQQSPEEFINKFLVEGIGVKEVVIGYDHHFGKGRGGNIDILKKMGKEAGFEVTAVSECSVGDKIISSTKIRNLINDGDLNVVSKMLGRLYSFNGTVVHGDDRGKKLGFPTANLKLDDESKILPNIGIYAVECILDDEKYYGLLSIGKRPTFHESGDIVPEVYLFDFEKDIYNKVLKVKVVERIREEKKFNSAEELIVQMKKDEEIGLAILSKLTN